MSFTGTDVVALARETLNDDALVRYKNPAGLKFVNAGLGCLALLRPDLFLVTANILTVANSAVQDVATAEPKALKLYAIYRVTGGDGISEADFGSLQRYNPSWQSEKSVASPVNWLRDPDQDPTKGSGTRYFLSPPAKTAIQVLAQFAKAPAELADLTETVPCTDPYKEVLANYVIYRFQSKDDEHVVTGRAQQAMQFYLQAIGLAKESKVIHSEGRPS